MVYVDTLDYLRRGGRIGAAQALLGQALAVKPILQLADGTIAPLEKVRTTGRAIARLVEIACEYAGSGPADVVVQHCAARRAGRRPRRRAARRAAGGRRPRGGGRRGDQRARRAGHRLRGGVPPMSDVTWPAMGDVNWAAVVAAGAASYALGSLSPAARRRACAGSTCAAAARATRAPPTPHEPWA